MPETPSAAADHAAPDDLISFLKAIPDGRYRREVRYPRWFLLLVAVLGILNCCRSSWNREAFAWRHREALNQALDLDFKRWPSDATCLYLFNNAHLQEFGGVLQAWMISQIPGGASGLDQQVCDGKTLRGSAIETEEGHHRFVAQVTVYARALGVALAQKTYDSHEIQRTCCPQRAAEQPGSRWRTDPGRRPAYDAGVVRWCLEQGGDVLLTVKYNQKTLHRQIGAQFQGKRQIPFTATDREKRHGPDIVWELRAREAPEHVKASWPGSAWTVEMSTTTWTRKSQRGTTRYLILTRIGTNTDTLLRLIRQRWSIENERHWARNVQLGEDAQRYADRIGAGVCSFLRTIVMNLFRRGGYCSIRKGFRELAYDIKGMLRWEASRRPAPWLDHTFWRP